MKKYNAVIFDLFDTIVNFNFNHLPEIVLKGFRSRTTSTEVYDVFKRYYPKVGFGDFYKSFIDSYHEFQELKLKEFREFPNRERFRIMLLKMDIGPLENQNVLEDEMVLAHMNALVSCVEFPEENRKTLEYVRAKGYKTAIVSNFDYGPTAYNLIYKLGIRSLVDEIIISCDVGWRKPKAIIFQSAIDKLDIKPEEALFVGDNFGADVVGSKSMGMDAAWININSQPEENLIPEPEFIVKRLSDLVDII